MIKLTENWRLESDAHSWVLVHFYKTSPTDKHPEGRDAEFKTYHPTIKQALNQFAQGELRENSEDLQLLLDAAVRIERVISNLKI